jgi:mycothiol synthase
MIYIENAPAINALRFRHFHGESDYPKIATVLKASEAADQSIREVTAQDIANAYLHMSNCDPYYDIICAEIDGKLVGYSRGWWTDESAPERTYIHNGFLVPEWRRQGIGCAMLLWMEERLSAIAAAHPAELSKLFQVNVSQYQKGTAILLERSSYQAVRYYYLMVRPSLTDIPEFPLPDGLEIHPVSPEHYRPIWRLVEATSQDEWGHKQPTETDYQEWLASPYFQPELWQIAWDKTTHEVVGQVLTYINGDENKQFNRLRGYTEGIGVARSWRRRGVARALISLSLLAQKAAGMNESALIADSDSNFNVTRLYESCGFQIVKCDTLYRKPILFKNNHL